MSFQHVGALIAPSTMIKDDTLVSYGDLDRVKAKIKTYEASSDKKIEVLDAIRNDLTKIIKAFNSNVECRRDEFGSKVTIMFKVISGTTLTAQSSDAPTSADAADATKVVGAKEIEDMLNAGVQDDALSFQQLGVPLDRLKGKIEKMIERAAKQSLTKDQFPELLQPEIVDKYKLQTLGQYQPVVASTSTSTTTSTLPTTTNEPEATLTMSGDLMSSTIFVTHTMTSPSTTTTTITTQVVGSGTTLSTPDASVPTSPPTPAQSSPPAHWLVKKHHFLAHNRTLGICHEPEWSAKPVPFTTNDGGATWEGQIPWGVKFKYVIIAGQELNWEIGDNRRITDVASADLVANYDASFYYS